MVTAAIISLGSVSTKWTEEEMKKYFTKVDLLDIRKIEINMDSKKPEILYEGKPIESYHCVYVKGSFRYLTIAQSISKILEGKCYMPFTADSFTIGHDKLATQLALQAKGIPMPTTYLAATSNAVKEILKRIHFPIIMKFPQGTQGKGVMFAESIESASSMLDALSALKQPVLIQEYIETNGVDTRAIVVGNKVVASMKRIAKSDEKRANTHAGGMAEMCILDEKTRRIAIESAKAVGADVCGVDILDSNKGPLVLEVNVSPGLQGVTGATKINVAEEIAKALYDNTNEFYEKNTKIDHNKIIEDLLEKNETKKELIINMDIRNGKIVLPSLVNQMAKFKEDQEVTVSLKTGEVSIKKF